MTRARERERIESLGIGGDISLCLDPREGEYTMIGKGEGVT